MPETDADRRGYALLLVGHDVLSGPGFDARLARSVLAWADAHQVGLYQLPVAAHRLRLPTSSGRAGRPRRAELDDEDLELEVVSAALGDYRAAGYRVLGMALRADDERTQAGRAWLAKVLIATAPTSGKQLAVWRIPRGAQEFEPAGFRPPIEAVG